MIKISGLEHLTASKQLEVLEGLLNESEGRPISNQEECSGYLKYSKTVGLGYEELGGLLDPGQQDCL